MLLLLRGSLCGVTCVRFAMHVVGVHEVAFARVLLSPRLNSQRGPPVLQLPQPQCDVRDFRVQHTHQSVVHHWW